ncbi:MAG: hypothetical protein ACK5QX_04715, partial [bacterium]
RGARSVAGVAGRGRGAPAPPQEGQAAHRLDDGGGRRAAVQSGPVAVPGVFRAGAWHRGGTGGRVGDDARRRGHGAAGGADTRHQDRDAGPERGAGRSVGVGDPRALRQDSPAGAAVPDPLEVAGEPDAPHMPCRGEAGPDVQPPGRPPFGGDPLVGA